MPLVIVHLKVTVFPAVRPVTVLVLEVGVVIVTPGLTPNTLHAPVPVLGLLPAKVNVVVLH